MKLIWLIFIPLILFGQQKENVFTQYLTGMETRWTPDSLIIGHRITMDTLLTFPMTDLTIEDRANLNSIWREWKEHRDLFNRKIANKFQVKVDHQGFIPTVYRGRMILREDRIASLDSSKVIPFKARRSLTQAGGKYYWVLGYRTDAEGFQYLIDSKGLIDYFVPVDATMDSLRAYLNDINSIPVWFTEEL